MTDRDAADGIGPLSGVRVLDLIDGMGVYGPRLLTMLGADVVKVEPPGGSSHRQRAPLYRAQSAAGAAAGSAAVEQPSLYFLHYNAGKRGVTLDGATSRGRELIARLLDDVDVVFDNGHLARWGFDLQQLAAGSRLVVVSVTPFGLEGERSDWQGGDLVCQAMGGVMQIYGHRNERPARLGPEQGSEMSGLAAALGALIAVFGAGRNGEGELLDIAVERVCALPTLQMGNASLFHQFGFRRERVGPGEDMPSGLYRARDGWMTIGAFRVRADAMVEAMQALGAGDELTELRARLSGLSFVDSDELDDALARAVATLPRLELMDAIQDRGIHALPVTDSEQLVDDPFLQQRGFFVDIEEPSLGVTFADMAPPMRFGASPARIGRRPPLLGEHNAEVLAGLGVDGDELAALAQAGVV
jgi:crotonobetainyl-CoA:carnitine CoA-transferase CaiB-like acyl-CoA transferase